MFCGFFVFPGEGFKFSVTVADVEELVKQQRCTKTSLSSEFFIIQAECFKFVVMQTDVQTDVAQLIIQQRSTGCISLLLPDCPVAWSI